MHRPKAEPFETALRPYLHCTSSAFRFLKGIAASGAGAVTTDMSLTPSSSESVSIMYVAGGEATVACSRRMCLFKLLDCEAAYGQAGQR